VADFFAGLAGKLCQELATLARDKKKCGVRRGVDNELICSGTHFFGSEEVRGSEDA
jgi:hypothetical protein